MLAGVHRGCLMLHIAGIGQGKTTTAIQLYVSGAIESGENVLIISNEQGVSEFRSMLMAYVLFNKIKGVKGMNRQKLVIGRFTDEQKEKLKEAAAWISAQPGKISFVEMQDYEITNIKKAVKKYSKLGYGLILVDTIKPLNEAEQGAWAQFSEVSKSLFLLAKQTDTAIICTAQASAESLGRKYLDLSCIAKSRAIAETASQVVGFRPVTNDEVNKIKPYTFKRNPDGSNSKIKTLVDLDPDEHYIVLFVMKNRFGSIFPQIVYRFNQTFCQLEEIGYYDQPYDGGNAKK